MNIFRRWWLAWKYGQCDSCGREFEWKKLSYVESGRHTGQVCPDCKSKMNV